MKKNILIGLVFMLAASLNGNAQTADEIINKYVETYGGLEKLNKLTTVIQKGVLENDGEEDSIICYINNKVGYKIEIEHEGLVNYEIVTANEGVGYFPAFGKDEVVSMPEEVFKVRLFNLFLLPAFINYAENNNTVEFKGTMEIDGLVAYQLEVTTQTGQRIDYFIDKKTSYLIKTIYMADQIGIGTPIREIKYSDFRVVADKYIFPFTVIDDLMGKFQFSDIEVNVPVKDSKFKP